MSLSSEISRKIAARNEVCSFKVANLILYESAIRENDRERSWSWRELSRALL